jgi:hypothetical protein
MFRQYFLRFGFLLATVATLSACGGSASAPAPASSSLTTSQPPITTPTSAEEDINNPQNGTEIPDSTPVTLPASSKMILSGRVTYDRVPFEGRTFRGLDYSRTFSMPARGVTVQLLDSNHTVHASGYTDDDGHYSFSIDKNQSLRVRVLAELRGNQGAAWDIQMRDNTAGNAQYVLDGSLASVGDHETQTRNLHAASGWDGDGYTGSRSAAPFAVLDSLYDALQTVISADPDVVLPPLTVFWSEKNIAINGDSSQGYIGTSFYTSAGPSIYLLGAADNDSDEYDRGVVQHEFGHYLEHQLGRTESIGGSHNQTSRLDMRVAFGEAWGNAFAGMVSGDPIYRDSLGANQSMGFAINVENRSYGTQGWFSEASIQAFLYDVFDDAEDGGDQLSLGFKPIYEVLTSERYLNFDGLASIFAFRAELETQQPQLAGTLSNMLQNYDISGAGWYGAGETNNAGSAVTLPVYHQVTPGQTINVCSDSDFQKYNGVDVRRFLRIHLPDTRNYTISAMRNGGNLARTNPQLRIYRQGNQAGSVLNGTPDSENAQRYLSRGDYVFEVYEESNADHSTNTGGLACFDVRIQ